VKNADEVAALIKDLKKKGNPLSYVTWKAALACVGWAYVFGARGELCTVANRRRFNASKGAEHPTIASKCKGFNSGDCSGCKWFPGGKRTRFFDCRGYTYWLLLQVYGWKLMGAGCTAQWNTASNWKVKGEISDGIPQDVIVCLFYYKKDSKGRRTKTLAHTGLYYNGQTCECSSGVQHFTTLNKKWDVWGIPACVGEDAGTPIKPDPGPEKRPMLRRGSSGKYVKELQETLVRLGYDVGKAGADGKFGKNTEAAVKKFQKDNKLKEDGIVGEKTYGALDAATKGGVTK